MRGFHGWMTIFWAISVIPSLYFGVTSSVTYVAFLSIYALFIGHFSSWQATRVEVRQEEITEQGITSAGEKHEEIIEKIDDK